MNGSGISFSLEGQRHQQWRHNNNKTKQNKTNKQTNKKKKKNLFEVHGSQRMYFSWSKLYYSATTQTGPLGTKLTNHKVNWEQWKATFLVNGPMTFKNTNNSFTTKFENSTTLHVIGPLTKKVAFHCSQLTLWLVNFVPSGPVRVVAL